jgi:NTE family protein
MIVYSSVRVFANTYFMLLCAYLLLAFGVHELPAQPPPMLGRRPVVALALSGGGARGIVQVGVLKVFEREGIPIDFIAGTSIGAIIGGLYAAGYTAQELDSILTTLNWNDAFTGLAERERAGEFFDQKAEADRSIVAVRFKNWLLVPPDAVSGGLRFMGLLNSLVWNAPYHAPTVSHSTNAAPNATRFANGFDALKIPFRAIATDLVHGTIATLGGGDLAQAIRASATFPLRFSPVKQDSMLLVDGGLLANVPVQAARAGTSALKPDIVIAVDNTSLLAKRENISAAWTIADQAATVMMRARSEGEAATADVLIKPLERDPWLRNHGNSDFTNLRSLIVAGERAAEAALPALREAFARIASPSVHTLRTDDSSAAPRIGTIGVSGVSPKPRDSLRLIVQAFTGRPATRAVLQQLAEAATAWYRKAGYSLAQVLVRPATQDESSRAMKDSNLEMASIVVVCNEGLVRSVRIIGDSSGITTPLSTTRRKLIERELPFRKGEPFNAEKSLVAWQGLMATNFFNDVNIRPVLSAVPASSFAAVVPPASSLENTDGSGVDVEVRAEERASTLMRFGARIDNERNVQGGLDVIDDNLFDTGLKTSLRVAGGLRNTYAQVTVTALRILNSTWQLGVRGYVGRTNIYRYRDSIMPLPNFERVRFGESAIDRIGFKAVLGEEIERNGLLSAEFRYEQQRFFDFDNPLRPALVPLNTLKLQARFDNQDRAFFPTVGPFLDISLEFPVLNLPGGVGFTKIELNYANTVSWGEEREHTIRPSLHVGLADQTLPVTELFSLGGEDIFYGMREDEARNAQLLRASLEYRYRLPFNVFGLDTYVSARYDAGSTWADATRIRISDVRHGVGVSAAVNAPFGPARVSLGRSFYFIENPNGAVWGPPMVYFSVGIRI